MDGSTRRNNMIRRNLPYKPLFSGREARSKRDTTDDENEIDEKNG